MWQLLRIEWLKLRPYRTFWILGILYLISIFSANYIGYRIQQEIYREEVSKGMAEMLIGTPPYAFPNVWHTAAWISSWLLYFPGLMMIIIMSNEFTYKTHRQNIIDGWSRRQFITVKFAWCFIAALLSTLVMTLTALFFGFINRESFSADKMIFVFYFFVVALSYSMVALLISLLLKRGGLAIGLFFLYGLVLENVIAALMNYYLKNAGRYLPLESADDLLMPLPLFERAQKQIIVPYNHTLLFIFAMGYLGAYFYLTYRKFKKADL
jgi:ABC-2 type transport system permease protein